MRSINIQLLFFCFNIIILPAIVCAQEKSFPLDTLHDQLSSINSKINDTDELLFDVKEIILDHLGSHKRLIDSSLNLNQITTERLNVLTDNIDSRKELEIANHTMKTQSYMIDAYGVLFAGVGLFLILFSLLTTILVYFLGIKPARKAVDEIKEDVSAELQSLNQGEIKSAIENLDSPEQMKKSRAISIVRNNYWNLTEDHRNAILTKLLGDSLTDATKGSLIHLVMDKKNKLVELFFKEANKKTIPTSFAFMRYAGINGYKQYLDLIVEYIEASIHPHSHLLELFKHLESEDLIEAQNLEKLVELMDEGSLNRIYFSTKPKDSASQVETYEGTLLDEKIKKYQ